MPTARERLQELTLAQQDFREQAEAGRQASQVSLPRGGEILTRPIRPSQAEQLEPERGTPLIDLRELFLNQIGLSSARQRQAQVDTLIAVNEANRTMLQAVKEQMALVANRGIGGVDVERFRSAQLQLQSAEKLIDNPVPEIQEVGRAQLQGVAEELDALTTDQANMVNQQKQAMQGRIEGLVALGRAEQLANDDIIAILNERGERNGINSPLSLTEKQVLSNYLNGTPFTQKEATRGLFENLPFMNIPYDPTEEITVGNASALIAAVSERRGLTIADQIGKENQLAVRSGLRFADQDGKLTVEEIPVPELGPDMDSARFSLPTGVPLSISPGAPTAEQARAMGSRELRTLGNAAGGVLDALGITIRRPGESLADFQARSRARQSTVRETN